VFAQPGSVKIKFSPQPFWAVDPALLQSALGQVPGFKYDKDYAPGLPIYRDEGGFAGTGGYWVPVVPGNKTTQYASGSAPAGSYIFQPDTHVGSAFQEAWGNGFGMAMSPFLAGLGGMIGNASGPTEAGAGGAMDMGGSAGVFDAAGNPLYSSPGMLPSLTQLGTNFGTNLLNSGGDIKSALKNTAVNTGIGVGASAAASGINTAFAPTNEPSRFGEDVMYADAGDPTKRGMLPGGDVMFSPNSYMNQPGFLNAPDVQSAFDNSVSPVSTDIPQGQTIPAGSFTGYNAAGNATFSPAFSPRLLDATAQHQTLRQAAGIEPYTPPSTEGATPATDTAPSPDIVSAQQIESLAKINSALAQLHQGRGTPEDAPQRAEGQTDQQYGQTLTDYLNSDPRTAIDPQVLSDAGITPGTDAYYEFVMNQLDSVISQITDGLDPDSPNLAERLRTKSREELDALERALFVRGQLGTLVGSGRQVDPFTGLQEDVNTGGAQVNPSLAAYHRGLYRSASELSHMNPLDARKYVGGMLDRSPDLFGMQGAHNARTLDEILSQQNMDPEDLKRRRGMFAQDPFANLGSMSERDLEATLASLLH
jgi:hypothetical protein